MSTASASLEQLYVNTIRSLAIDGVQKANSGHPGLPLGAAPMAYTLWTRHLRHNPRNPKWFNRDRFILSAGHGSMLLYSLLHLTGYDLPLDELRQFRQWNSKTPGHPENHITPGVEMATGPLGQGVATSVGMAIAERFLAATFNRPGHTVVDHFTYVICSDGDLMEGVAQEGCSLAGHLKLGKLIMLYDDNGITIDGNTSRTFTEDTAAKFEAMKWQVLRADGNDVEQIDRAIQEAKKEANKPTLIMCKTTIGFGSPNKAGSPKSHGAPLGTDEVVLTKKALGVNSEEEFFVPTEVREFFGKAVDAGIEAEDQWNEALESYEKAFPTEAAQLHEAISGDLGSSWTSKLPTFADNVATRAASLKTINSIASELPTWLGGCADLAESVYTDLKDYEVFQPETPTGRNLAYGIREHAMAAASNGITLHGGCRTFAGTFLVFSDYCRPSVRLSAIMHCPTTFVFSHDSIGLGEDGPTHQPVEQIMSLRMIPNLNVMRPADGNETAACWKIALESKETPCVLALTRQAVPALTPDSVTRHPAEKGAYILQEASSVSPKLILIATGSEVGLAVEARTRLESEGIPTRVVNMPSWFLFEQQPEEYRKSVLIGGIPTISVEAGATLGWQKYADVQIGLDHFGASAPGPFLMKQFGFMAENIIDKAKALLAL